VLDRSVLQVYVDIIPTGESIDVLVATKKLVIQVDRQPECHARNG
jgi:hypothetical protein